jgi:hypothetical protein
LIIPFSSLKQWENLDHQLGQDKQFASDGADYLKLHIPTLLISVSSVLLKTFSGMQAIAVPE